MGRKTALTAKEKCVCVYLCVHRGYVCVPVCVCLSVHGGRERAEEGYNCPTLLFLMYPSTHIK